MENTITVGMGFVFVLTGQALPNKKKKGVTRFLKKIKIILHVMKVEILLSEERW